METSSWARASFLNERRAGSRLDATSDARDALTTWQAGMWVDEGTFRERLALDGLDEEDLLGILSRSELDGEGAGAPWTSVLEDIRSGVYAHEILPPLSVVTPAPSGDGQQPQSVPFGGFVRPFLQVGVGRLRTRLAELEERYHTGPPLGAAAETELLGALLSRLLAHSTRTLVLELNVARMLDRLEGSSPQARFQSFSEAHWEDLGNVLAVLEEYPVLARLAATSVDRWVEVTTEFFDRFLSDRGLLSQTFCPGSDIGIVTSGQTGLSDLHRGGRSVVKVTFRSGITLIYKPRPLAVEVRFQQLLASLNTSGLPLPHRLLRVIDRGDYGWVEFARADPCTSREEVERFYWRQGSYLALLYMLKAVDFHFENLIACGEHPVLVDLEALFHHDTPRPGSERAYDKATDFLGRSVLRVSFLPMHILGQDGKKGVDLSGLGGEPGQLMPRPVPGVEDGHTDTMRITGKYVEVSGGQNRPYLDGERVTAVDFVDEVVCGFRQTYEHMRRHREALAPRFRAFGEVEVRHILRPTRRYALFLQEGHHPDYLRDGLDRDRLLDKLWAETDLRPALKRVVRAEQQDLRLGDIPVFTARPGHRHLWDSRGACIPDFFETESLTEVLDQLAGMSERDCDEQVTLIRSSLVRIQYGVRLHPLGEAGDRSLMPSRRDLLGAAVAIGETLAAKAIRGRTDACWIGVDLRSLGNQIWELSATGTDLYAGVGGMALFFGYLAAASGRSDFEELARAALQPIRHHLSRVEPDEYPIIGAFSGRASEIYVLQHLANLWGDTRLLDEALGGLPEIARLIPSDRHLDIIGGAAGCAIVLLGLYQQTGEQAVIEAAWQCGQRLLETAAPQRAGWGWAISGESDALAGFSHGVAGIAWALLRLAEATGDQRFREAAHRGWAYERTLFVPERENWRDLRRSDDAISSDPDYIPAGWCHGAPGVALGRLLAMPLDDAPEIRDEAILGIGTTLREGFGGSHCLCHGDVGNLDILGLAEKAFGDGRWRDTISRHSASLSRRLETGQWRCGLPGAQVEIPGFMLGLAGIGYGLLRLWSPTAVPSVLWLEPPRARPDARR